MAVEGCDLTEVVELLEEVQRDLPPVDPAHWTPAMRVEEARRQLADLAVAADDPSDVEAELDEMIETVEALCEAIEDLFPAVADQRPGRTAAVARWRTDEEIQEMREARANNALAFLQARIAERETKKLARDLRKAQKQKAP